MTLNSAANPNVASHALVRWVTDSARLMQPDCIVWCDGSPGERERLLGEAVKSGVLIPLNPRKRPGCYLHRSDPNDVARTEQVTFICTPSAEDAGITNNWMAPDEAYRKLGSMLEGSMRGRTMYVIPYILGPIGSPYAKVGVEITDSIYVVLSMGLMTRMGTCALSMLGNSDDFNRGLHCTLDLNPERRFICHFPQDNTIWSVGSGYGGNALLSKKCFALRIASWLGRNEGWFAEHMLIVGVRNPEGHTRYIAAAFPSACGKTNLAMLLPPPALGRWKVFTVGDDIAWLRVGPDGRLWAINPENGYFGVAPGTSAKSNPNAMRMLGHNSIFTNVAMTADGDVWWEGMDIEPPPELLDWQGRKWRPDCGDKAAHPNSRFTTPIANNPALSPHVEDPCGVPISAIVFGGRRATTAPLVLEAKDWLHGVFIGATMGSETTAAAAGQVGVVRRDPMAMLPFAGYNIGDYWQHWLTMQPRIAEPPRIFMVNWFRKDADGAFLWPGYSENLRVLKWMMARIDGRVKGRETLLGTVPEPAELDLSGLKIAPESLRQALAVDRDEWKAEMASAGEFFDRIGPSVPAQLRDLHRDLTNALESSHS
ncbi:MAG: phosphoenolpyruvate carboxykinase (GTP) [Deltaproteobacteria bacterium]|nr:phosphoenolpyruvate carboxykinase (GTP) [Deltaproteobacteria bacterium]